MTIINSFIVFISIVAIVGFLYAFTGVICNKFNESNGIQERENKIKRLRKEMAKCLPWEREAKRLELEYETKFYESNGIQEREKKIKRLRKEMAKCQPWEREHKRLELECLERAINAKRVVEEYKAKRLAREKKTKLRQKENREINPLNSNNRYIPSAVKTAVWRRDGGRCVQCGSNERLEYDHIIPVSKGGSNTERNIQILCEKCNRSKSAKIQ